MNFDSAPTTSDLIIVMGTWNGDPGTITWPANWTSIANTVNSNTRLVIRYHVAGAGEASSISLTTTSNARMAAFAIRVNAGSYNTGNNPQAGTTATSSSANPDPPNVNAAWGSDDILVIAVGAESGTNTTSVYPYADNNLNRQSTGSGAAVCTSQMCTTTTTASSANPGTFTVSASSAWLAQTVLIRGVTASIPNKIVPVQFAVRRASFY